ncbi:MAG TPA: hypothetical protein VJ546_03860, partial [Bacillales bacterium]|nr:hypothetical protein [Bacillales bacterium]
KLNDVINALKEKEIKYKQEIDNLNKTIQDKEKKYNEQIKQLEKNFIEKSERIMTSSRSRRTPQSAPTKVAKLNSPDIFYEKRPYYNELNVSKVIDPFGLNRAIN